MLKHQRCLFLICVLLILHFAGVRSGGGGFRSRCKSFRIPDRQGRRTVAIAAKGTDGFSHSNRDSTVAKGSTSETSFLVFGGGPKQATLQEMDTREGFISDWPNQPHQWSKFNEYGGSSVQRIVDDLYLLVPLVTSERSWLWNSSSGETSIIKFPLPGLIDYCVMYSPQHTTAVLTGGRQINTAEYREASNLWFTLDLHNLNKSSTMPDWEQQMHRGLPLSRLGHQCCVFGGYGFLFGGLQRTKDKRSSHDIIKLDFNANPLEWSHVGKKHRGRSTFPEFIDDYHRSFGMCVTDSVINNWHPSLNIADDHPQTFTPPLHGFLVGGRTNRSSSNRVIAKVTYDAHSNDIIYKLGKRNSDSLALTDKKHEHCAAVQLGRDLFIFGGTNHKGGAPDIYERYEVSNVPSQTHKVYNVLSGKFEVPYYVLYPVGFAASYIVQMLLYLCTDFRLRFAKDMVDSQNSQRRFHRHNEIHLQRRLYGTFERRGLNNTSELGSSVNNNNNNAIELANVESSLISSDLINQADQLLSTAHRRQSGAGASTAIARDSDALLARRLQREEYEGFQQQPQLRSNQSGENHAYLMTAAPLNSLNEDETNVLIFNETMKYNRSVSDALVASYRRLSRKGGRMRNDDLPTDVADVILLFTGNPDSELISQRVFDQYKWRINLSRWVLRMVLLLKLLLQIVSWIVITLFYFGSFSEHKSKSFWHNWCSLGLLMLNHPIFKVVLEMGLCSAMIELNHDTSYTNRNHPIDKDKNLLEYLDHLQTQYVMNQGISYYARIGPTLLFIILIDICLIAPALCIFVVPFGVSLAAVTVAFCIVIDRMDYGTQRFKLRMREQRYFPRLIAAQLGRSMLTCVLCSILFCALLIVIRASYVSFAVFTTEVSWDKSVNAGFFGSDTPVDVSSSVDSSAVTYFAHSLLDLTDGRVWVLLLAWLI